MAESRENLYSAGWRDRQDSTILPQTDLPQDTDSLRALAPQLVDHKADLNRPVEPEHVPDFCDSLQIEVPDLPLFSQLLKHSSLH